MTATSLPWLPKDALEPACFERAISTLVGEWSEAWFVKVRASCRIKLRAVAANGPSMLAWRQWGDECGVGIDEAGRLALAEAMLDRSIPATAVGPNDRPLLDNITKRCVEDLLGRVGWLIDRDRSPEIVAAEFGGPTMTWEIGLKKANATLSLMVGQGALVRWRKSLAPRSPTRALMPLAKALAPQPVEIAVGLGASRLTLAEVEGLSAGDVVMLDSKTGDVLALRAAGQPIPIKGRLSQDASGPSLNIIEAKKAG